MLDAIAGWSPRRRLLTCTVAVTVVAVVVLVVLAFAHGSAARRPAAASTTTSPRASASTATPTAQRPYTPPIRATLPRLPSSDEPVAYAREVAAALFDVNPASVTRSQFVQFWTGEVPSVVYADAAAKGLTLNAQNSDVIDNLTRSWIPTQAAWDAEAAEHTTNQFTITSVSVPDYWVNAIADGEFRDPGLHMERVMGVLTQRYGTDPAHRASASRSVVIDLGLLCGPTQPGGCRLVAPQQLPDLGDS
jgi:hypothetical protein